VEPTVPCSETFNPGRIGTVLWPDYGLPDNTLYQKEEPQGFSI
jgi:hypothetical protein